MSKDGYLKQSLVAEHQQEEHQQKLRELAKRHGVQLVFVHDVCFVEGPQENIQAYERACAQEAGWKELL